MKKTSVSAVICTRNAAHYLADCLQSLLDQSVPADEVLVVDGNSQDETSTVLESYKERFGGRLRWLDQGSTPGLAAARNVALREATGSIISFLDVDARACADWVQDIQREFNEKPGLAGVGGQGIEVPVSDADRFRARYYQQTWGPKSKTNVPFLFGLASHYRRKIVLEVGGFNERFLSSGEDVELGLRLGTLGYRMDYQPNLLVYHSRRDDWKTLVQMADRWAFFGRQAGLVRGQPPRPWYFWIVWCTYASTRQLLRDMTSFNSLPSGWWKRPYFYAIEARAAWRAQGEFSGAKSP